MVRPMYTLIARSKTRLNLAITRKSNSRKRAVTCSLFQKSLSRLWLPGKRQRLLQRWRAVPFWGKPLSPNKNWRPLTRSKYTYLAPNICHPSFNTRKWASEPGWKPCATLFIESLLCFGIVRIQPAFRSAPWRPPYVPHKRQIPK